MNLKGNVDMARQFVDRIERERTALPEVRRALDITVTLAEVALSLMKTTAVPPGPRYYLDGESIDLELFLEGPWGRLLTVDERVGIRALAPGQSFTIGRDKTARTRPIDFFVVQCKGEPT